MTKEEAATTYAEERFTDNYYGIYGDKYELKCAFLAGIDWIIGIPEHIQIALDMIDKKGDK